MSTRSTLADGVQVELFDLPAASVATNVPVVTIRKKIRQGQIRAVECGARIYITRPDLLQWIAALPEHRPGSRGVDRSREAGRFTESEE